jgi:TrkA domain protein
MIIRESDLPGIGKKYQIDTKSGERIVVVIHDDGRREIYQFDKDDYEQSISTVTFDDTEARQIAAIIGGMTYKPKALETIEMAFDDLVIEWYKVEPNAYAINKTIGELDIRQNFDVIVIAILRKNHTKIINPGPEEAIHEGDTLIVSGERAQLNNLKKKLLTGGNQ